MIDAASPSGTQATRAATLFTAYRAGDEAGLGELVALLTPLLWHTVRAQRVGREAAEDVVQATWLSLVRSAERIADPQAVLQWLIVTAKRESWRVVRRADRDALATVEDVDVALPASEQPEQLAVQGDHDARLWQHIATLPERCQALLRVIAFADRPDYADVARALGMPIGSIGPTRGRCLAKLRRRLAADTTWEA